MMEFWKKNFIPIEINEEEQTNLRKQKEACDASSKAATIASNRFEAALLELDEILKKKACKNGKMVA